MESYLVVGIVVASLLALRLASRLSHAGRIALALRDLTGGEARVEIYGTKLGPFRVGSVTLQIEEPSEPSISNARSASHTFVRRLPTVVRYPAAGPPNAYDNPGAPPARADGTFPLAGTMYPRRQRRFPPCQPGFPRAKRVFAPAGRGSIRAETAFNHQAA